MEQRKFKVNNEVAGTRLDIYLTSLNNDLSRTFIKNQIETDKVLVNGVREFRANYRIQEDDEITLQFETNKSTELKPYELELDTIYEDDDLIVINKPPHLSVHPVNFEETNTLVNALVSKYKGLINVGTDKLRSSLIHRLDKGTSGVILIGKTNKGLRYYSKQFAERNVQKYYICISKNRATNKIKLKQTITVENFLKRNQLKRKKISISDSGRYSKTDITLVDVNQEYSLFLCKPYTGRTHQIRVHIASLGFPILGDPVYGGAKFDRMMLHAWKLEVVNLENKAATFEASIPNEFIKIFPKIKQSLNDVTKNI